MVAVVHSTPPARNITSFIVYTWPTGASDVGKYMDTRITIDVVVKSGKSLLQARMPGPARPNDLPIEVSYFPY